MNDDFEGARKSIGDLIGASPRSIGFCANVSSGLAMIAGSLPIMEGDNVICAKGEFPANIYPWMNLERRGVEVRFIDPAPGYATPDMVLKLIDSKTKAVSLSWVGFSNGARIDTGSIGALCKEKEIFFIVDAIQGLGALKVDLSYINFLVCGGGKWSLSPQGGGFVYIDPGLINDFYPDRTGWLSMAANADMKQFHSLTDYKFDLADDARRIEPGSNSILCQLALGESCRYIHSLDPVKIEKRIVDLCDYLIDGLLKMNLDVTSYHGESLRSGIVTFSTPDPVAKADALFKEKIVVSAREGNIRVGIHFYNNEDDLDRLLSVI